ncbi:protease complex subunit PrcB family protein [Clostridium boliviensis]|uniref:Protease complex subunit PrcB family protein n=3 Tax=Clostridia TaxID=186801 RepID=A0ABU4GP32_9CLOT|nr:protease complex subunit PrcB family protein [Clostridium boliviensis]MDW2798688.1 protease complex subunit PrcB family protein [Clostridium boliviensis]
MIFFGLAMWVLVVRTLSGCTVNGDNGDKVRDLDFSVVADTDIPQELKQIIAEKQQSPFKLTYSDDKNLYIVVGYGKQDTGGYSIAVNDLYLTDNSIVLDTELIGPEKGENTGTEPSYPFIVIRTEMSELPVVFQ